VARISATSAQSNHFIRIFTGFGTLCNHCPVYYSQSHSTTQNNFGKKRPAVYYIETTNYYCLQDMEQTMEDNVNKEKPIRCESILHCKATAVLKESVKADLEEEDKPLKEILDNAEDQE